MNERLDELLQAHARQKGATLGGAGHGGELEWNSPENFARFGVSLAIRDFNFPLETEAQAFTEGMYDRGLDGISIALGDMVLHSKEDVSDALALNPTATPKILFLQAKSGKFVNGEDVGNFGNSVQAFLTRDHDTYLRIQTNELVKLWYEIFDELRTQMGEKFQPEVYLVFFYNGEWKYFANPSQAGETALENLKMHMPQARMELEIWGSDELLAAADRAGPRVSVKMKDVKLQQLPKGTACPGFTGYVSARSLIDAFSRKGRLAQHFFAENPRHYLGNEERFNPGAAGLEKSLKNGKGSQVLLCHNGVVITARRATLYKDGSIEIVAPNIINGCQSCYTLDHNRKHLDGVYLQIKVIATDDEALIDAAVIGSNTHAQVHNYDMLARRTGVRALESRFVGGTGFKDHLWLETRRNQRFEGSIGVDGSRILSPRHLLHGFGAVIQHMPHAVHSGASSFLVKAEKEDIFADWHDPTIYRAIGWLIVTGRRWSRRHDIKWWDRYTGSNGGYPARHQFIHALWYLTDDTPDATGDDDIRIGRITQDRFERVIQRLVSDGDRLGDLAGEAVDRATGGRRLSANLARTADFTTKVLDEVAKMKVSA
ncbi:MAG: AIPR family protein [Hyphomicrobiaceae bacterium]|nr:AIPR family protein [Hyphomicrobiaceae bacterium]